MVKVQTNSQGNPYITSNGKALLSNGVAGKYQLFDRISDDSNNAIGTVAGFFTDANNIEYAVICLDAQYRPNTMGWCSNSDEILGLASLYNAETLYANKDTATSNTQKILDYCTAGGYTSGACSHCRNQSFTIDGTTYYGQLPNLQELMTLLYNYSAIDSADTSTGTTLLSMLGSSYSIWSSSQDGSNAWLARPNGTISSSNKTANNNVVPILEIPNN